MADSSQPYRVLISGANGAVMSFRTFDRADDAASFVEGVIVGYWWRPVTLGDNRGPTEQVPHVSRTRLQIWRNEYVLVDRPLHEMTVQDLDPVTQLWRDRAAS